MEEPQMDGKESGQENKETTNTPKDPLGDVAKNLKDNLEVLEKLRARRKEIKSELGRDLLEEREERRLAYELARVSRTIGQLGRYRKNIYAKINDLVSREADKK